MSLILEVTNVRAMTHFLQAIRGKSEETRLRRYVPRTRKSHVICPRPAGCAAAGFDCASVVSIPDAIHAGSCRRNSTANSEAYRTGLAALVHRSAYDRGFNHRPVV